MKRSVVTRAGIGTHLRIWQARSAEFRRLFMEQPTILVIRRGTKVILADTGAAEAEAGAAIAVDGGVFVTAANRTDGTAYEAEGFAFDPDLMGPVDPGALAGPVARAFVPPEGFEAALDAARDALADTALPFAVARHRMGELLVWLRTLGINPRPGVAEAFPVRLRRLVGTDPAAAWTSAEVARALAVSEATLRRRLSAHGTTLTDVLGDVRMTRALTLLQSTDLSVTTIALDCGYLSPSRFAVRFRARFGMSPLDIRRTRRVIERIGTEFDRRGGADQEAA
jgi:AraC-like DNA-binding protein